MRILEIGFLVFTVLSAVVCDSITSQDKSQPEVTSYGSPNPDNAGSSSSPIPMEISLLVKDDRKPSGTNEEVTLDELLLFKSMTDEEKATLDTADSTLDNIQTSTINGDIDSISSTPEGTTGTTFSNIRRKGDLSPSGNEEKPDSSDQFDDDKENNNYSPPPRFGQRSRTPNFNSGIKNNINIMGDNINGVEENKNDRNNGIRLRFNRNGVRDNRLRYGASNNNRIKTQTQENNKEIREESPVLQLAQGGYKRPIEESARFENPDISRTDSSEQSQTVQDSVGTSNDNRQPDISRVNPQVEYTGLLPPETNYPVQQQIRPELNLRRQNPSPPNLVAPQRTNQNNLINTQPMGFLNYPTTNLYSQFPGNNGISFNAHPLYQPPTRNPYLDTNLLFQRGPQVQPQPFLLDHTGNFQSQFPYTNFQTYPGFPSQEFIPRSSIESFFSTPTVNPQYQVPSNLFTMNPNEGYTSPPLNLISNFQNKAAFPSSFFRYPTVDVAQNRRKVTDQQTDSDTSQEKKVKESNTNESDDLTNSREEVLGAFGRNVPSQNEDIFIRYPTNEAGYAVEENLPPKNGSQLTPDEKLETTPPADRRRFPTFDPYENALNVIRRQRQNRTGPFAPEELFKDVSMDYGYQRPQNQIFAEYPGTNREILQPFPPSATNSRLPYNQVIPDERNQLYFNPVNRRRFNPVSEDTIPNCAKKNEAIFCFEDEEYPRNDVLYSVNSNSFLMERMSGPNVQLETKDFVEQNVSAEAVGSEDYACVTDTKIGTPLRAQNVAGNWRVIVNLENFKQPVRMEVCRSKGDRCSYVDSRVQTACVQKIAHQRLLTWTADRGIFTDVFKIPVACSCQILQVSVA